jgi:hypothetical protein
MSNCETRRLWRKRKKAEKMGIPMEQVTDGRGKHNNHTRGSSHYKWNGELLTQDGYRLVRVGVDHPLSDPNGYVREHVLIASSVYGIDAVRGMVVHHINGDNRIENLQIISSSDHNKIHNIERFRDESTGRFVGKRRAGRLLDGVEHNEVPV